VELAYQLHTALGVAVRLKVGADRLDGHEVRLVTKLRNRGKSRLTDEHDGQRGFACER
jgi:hypothetical protein